MQSLRPTTLLATAPSAASPAESGLDMLAETAAELDRRAVDASTLLQAAIVDLLPGRICAVSSFGAESALILALIAEIDRATPVVFLETGKHFPETLAYRDQLIDLLGLTGVRSAVPDPAAVAAADPDGDLWSRRPDDCCLLRKVLPLEDALSGFDAWINGRKRFHGGGRAALDRVEIVEGRIKLNPLVDWLPAQIAAEFSRRGLPRHPLVAQGYLSIGCAPCTHRTSSGEPVRAGRWRGRDKTECGIHE